MPRPLCCRRIARLPVAAAFAPVGREGRPCDEVVLTLDELEALRLADLDGLYQEPAAARMGVSRSTFGRIVEAAHRKVAEALVLGKALRIEGGVVVSAPPPRPCPRCACERDGAAAGSTTCPRCRHRHEPRPTT